MSKRRVYFYETYVVHDTTGMAQRADRDFWPALRNRINGQDEKGRTVRVHGTDYVGELRTTASPAASYIYLGRLRTRDEWPDGYKSGVGFSVLEPDDADSLGEPAYLLDLSGSSRVAVTGRSGGAPRLTATELWLTIVSGVSMHHQSIELRPILNPNFARDLDRSIGAKRTRVRVDRAKEVPADGGGGLADAVRSAKNVSSEMDITVEMSVGHARASDAALASLGSGVRWAVRNEVPDSGSVSLVMEDEDGERHIEHYDLVKQRITEQAEIPDGQDGVRASEESVISAIQSAVERLQGHLR